MRPFVENFPFFSIFLAILGGHRDRGHPQRADQLLDHHRSVRCIRAAERLGTGIHLCRGSELHLRHGAIPGAVRQRHQLRAASGHCWPPCSPW